MVLKKEPSLKTVVDGLSILRAACEGRGKLGLTDLHVLAESFFCPFLNEAYKLKLKVLKTGHPAIDLGDAKAGEAFQITSDNSKKKIQDTLDTYSAKKLFATYPLLKVLIIGTRRDAYTLRIPEGVAFDQAADILDVHTLGDYIMQMDTARVMRMADIINAEIAHGDFGARSAPIQRRVGKTTKANQAAILMLTSFIQTLEGGTKNLPPVSWKRTFSPLDPVCANLTKKEMIRRLFSKTEHDTLVLYLGAVKGMYAQQMQRRDVQTKYAAVCQAFGVDYNELF